ncbi:MULTISPECIES: hypothetical protein [Mesorhizobium]|uniref:hypothetical protein n=1 Tax=Mesorhizobium TaxID=68287 RepID=UPI0013E909F5|nr:MULTISPECIES: hypothetical protein [Mesorhizobium]
MPGPYPHKNTDRETREAVVKTPDKTNDWDRDQVHGEGETIGIESERDDNLATAEMNAGIQMDGEVVEEDGDNAFRTATKHCLTMKRRPPSPVILPAKVGLTRHSCRAPFMGELDELRKHAPQT